MQYVFWLSVAFVIFVPSYIIKWHEEEKKRQQRMKFLSGLYDLEKELEEISKKSDSYQKSIFSLVYRIDYTIKFFEVLKIVFAVPVAVAICLLVEIPFRIMISLFTGVEDMYLDSSEPMRFFITGVRVFWIILSVYALLPDKYRMAGYIAGLAYIASMFFLPLKIPLLDIGTIYIYKGFTATIGAVIGLVAVGYAINNHFDSKRKIA